MYKENNWNGRLNPTTESNSTLEIHPVRPVNGTMGLELLRQDKVIEVKNNVAYWFAEIIEREADFGFCFHLNKHNKGWTTLYKY